MRFVHRKIKKHVGALKHLISEILMSIIKLHCSISMLSPRMLVLVVAVNFLGALQHRLLFVLLLLFQNSITTGAKAGESLAHDKYASDSGQKHLHMAQFVTYVKLCKICFATIVGLNYRGSVSEKNL